jgi:Tetracyclin repressor-like, C-terminal domain
MPDNFKQLARHDTDPCPQLLLRGAMEASGCSRNIVGASPKALRLEGDLAPQRAALVLSLIAGFQVMRQMIGLSALAEAEPETLVRILGPLFQQLIEGGQPSDRDRKESKRG